MQQQTDNRKEVETEAALDEQEGPVISHLGSWRLSALEKILAFYSYRLHASNICLTSHMAELCLFVILFCKAGVTFYGFKYKFMKMVINTCFSRRDLPYGQ
jgi:hypothetical protein